MVGELGFEMGFALAGRMGIGDGVVVEGGDDMARGVGIGRGDVSTMTSDNADHQHIIL